MTPGTHALSEVRQALEARGLTVLPGDTTLTANLKVDARDVWLSVEARAPYCDRGRWKVLPWPKVGPDKLWIDAHDGFPRYYFDAEAMATEIDLWLQARGQM